MGQPVRKFSRIHFFLCCILSSVLFFPFWAMAAPTIHTTQKTIVIDPGHGEKDAGITSKSGIKEKDITLEIALEVADILSETCNVLLTRTKNQNPSLEERIRFANTPNPDVFICLHISKNSLGTNIFYGKKSDAKAKALAAEFARHLPNSKQTFVFCAPMTILPQMPAPGILLEPFSMETLIKAGDRKKQLIRETAQRISLAIKTFLEKSDLSQ